MNHADQQTLQAYINASKAYPMVPADEARDLARKAQAGDVASRHKLVNSCLRLVVQLAQDHMGTAGSLLDLIQAGNEGLCLAVDKYDPDQAKFTTFAAWWVRAKIKETVQADYRIVRICDGRAARKCFQSLRRVRAELEAEGITPTPEAIADRLGPEVSPDDVREMIPRLEQPEGRLDAPLRSDEGDAGTVGDLMADDSIPDPETVAESQDWDAYVAKRIRDATADLDDRDQRIIEDRILNPDPPSLAALGSELGITRQALSLRERKIRAMLATRLADLR
jgi:RNA polymerase sigma-32 factor